MIVVNGNPAELRVRATGDFLTYSWIHNGAPLSNVGNIAGVTTDTLTLSSALIGDAGLYRVVVRNDADTVSSIGTLTVGKCVHSTCKERYHFP